MTQATYYFYSYFSLLKQTGSNEEFRFVVPSGNFGDILAGWFAKQMGLPAEKLVIATNENDILDRFFRSGGKYTKNDASGSGVKETHSPAMDILVSSNFERLLWFYAFQANTSGSLEERRKQASSNVSEWLTKLKTEGGFTVPPAVLEAAKAEFESERISNDETITQIRSTYNSSFPPNLTPGSATSSKTGGYILDPHSAVGVAASLRSIQRNPNIQHISLSTAHPAKFASSVDLALRAEDGYDFNEVLPQEFIGLEQRESRVTPVRAGAGWQGVRDIIKAEVDQELERSR